MSKGEGKGGRERESEAGSTFSGGQTCSTIPVFTGNLIIWGVNSPSFFLGFNES